MPTAFVLGATRGLGLALVRELRARRWDVVASGRSPEGSDLARLAEVDDGVEVVTADMTDRRSLAAVREGLGERRLDLLFVNGGITRGNVPGSEVSTEDFVEVMTTNALGPMRALAALDGAVTESGTIAVMSSFQGSVSLNERDGQDLYRASKSALNQLMRSYAARHRDEARTLLLVNPGHVRTGLGGDYAPMEVGDVIPGVVSAVLGRSGRGGLTFVDWKDEVVPW